MILTVENLRTRRKSYIKSILNTIHPKIIYLETSTGLRSEKATICLIYITSLLILYVNSKTGRTFEQDLTFRFHKVFTAELSSQTNYNKLGDEEGTQLARQQDNNKAIPHSTPLTLNWLSENYESAEGVCIPRNVIYKHYCDFCQKNGMIPVNPASFGKVRKLCSSGKLRLNLLLEVQQTLDNPGSLENMFSWLIRKKLKTNTQM